MEPLNLSSLQQAVAGDYAAIRRITTLEPQGDKVFPPTYEGGQYAEEERLVTDETGVVRRVNTVLLDSVQSQANRMESALLRAYDDHRLSMPMLEVNFAGDGKDPILKEVGRLTALEAPHRMCDAIFRDSEYDGQAFRKSELGAKLNTARAANATAVFGLCPPALLFGFWDSTGPCGGSGSKVQRALVSEIVGFEAVSGKRPTSRVDPLQIDNSLEIYDKEGDDWTLDEAEAKVGKDGKPIRLRAADINHGNITPSLTYEEKKTHKRLLNHGGVTMAYAKQHTVLSLAALRKLRFPLNGPEQLNDPKVDKAARTVLAALGMVAVCLLDDDDYDLRSRCLLIGKPGAWEFVGREEPKSFTLNADIALQILADAVNDAKHLGLPWPEKAVTLKPSEKLSRLVIKSQKP